MRCIDRSAADMETKNKKYLIILGVVAAVILAILAFIGIMVGVSLKSLTTQEREFIDQSPIFAFVQTSWAREKARPAANHVYCAP